MNKKTELSQETQSTFEKLMAAVEENSYDQFVADGDANFQASVRPQTVNGVHSQLLPRIAAGYAANYMGMLDRKSYVSHYWQLQFSDDKGDRLARLSLKAGKVHAFYIL